MEVRPQQPAAPGPTDENTPRKSGDGASAHRRASRGSVSSKMGRVERDGTGLQDRHGNEDLCSAEREVSVGGGRHTEVV